MYEAFKTLVDKYDKITVITHERADGDTIGTGLGLYAVLKSFGKQVEICNVNKKLPNYLDFLPHFAKIKNQIDFDNSLVITCDVSSLEMLGLDLALREIVNIDHHKSNMNYGTLNIIDSTCVSTSMVAYNLLKNNLDITKNTATCFYVALLSNTQSFTTLNVTADVFSVAAELVSLDVNLREINKNLTQRQSLSAFRLLNKTLETLELSYNAQVASLVVTKDAFEKTGAVASDLSGIINHAMALATVKIAILVVEFEDRIKVSLRSDSADVSSLAMHFGGGGHLSASGFNSNELDLNKLLNEIKIEIKERELLNGL